VSGVSFLLNLVTIRAMSDIKKLIGEISNFRDVRDWKQFHNPKDCAISLSLEASEVLEHFQWKNPEEIKKYVETNKDEVSEELADVLYWVLLMSGDLNIDIVKAFDKKMLKNAKKYPVNKAKGKHTKYNKL
jgi:NTP pyrophosphatase (non-canonical NTP hydrolase)